MPTRPSPARRSVRGSILVALAPLLLALAGAAEPVWVTGITEPIKDVTMAFPLVGVVGARPLEEGAPVKRDQVLIELDKQLEELDVERKRLARDLAKSESDRLKSLAERNAISVSREEIDKKKGEYDIARLDHDLAIAILRRRQLLSPIEGRVARFFKDVGEKCEEQQPVVRVVDTRRCFLVANVEPALAHALQLEQEVALQVEAGATPIDLRGSVSYISPVVDPASGLLRIKVVFENADGRVRPGVTGRLRLTP
jgi:RND family efflux transporter MFP subunit